MNQNSRPLIPDILKVLFWVFIGAPVILGVVGFLVCLIGFFVTS